jgi:maleate isomerase
MGTQSESVETPTEKVSVRFEFDGGPARLRIGLIALSTNAAIERDFRNMLPDDVMFHTSRVMAEGPVTIENYRAMGPLLTEAVRQILPGMRLDTIAYSCTSGTVALGYDEVAAQIRKGRPEVPVVTPLTSAVAAMEKLGIQQVSLLTPYADSVNQAMRDFLELHGITVLNIGSFCIEDGALFAELPPDAIFEAALEVCRHDADALFIPCTGIRAVEIIERAEQALGKPALSAIQTLLWQCLRDSGYHESLQGYGQLLRD